MLFRQSCAVVFSILLAGFSHSAGGQEFHQINGMGAFGALGISPPSNKGLAITGAVVGGNGIAPGLWTEEKGLVPLHQDPTKFHHGGFGSAVSENGDYFAGHTETSPTDNTSNVTKGFFLWSEGKGYEELSQPVNIPDFNPRGVSNNGQTMVGTIDVPGGLQLGVWNRDTGFELFGDAAELMTARALSGDGQLAAAETRVGDLTEAIRWTKAAGLQSLSDIAPGLTEPSTTQAITGDAILGMVGDSPFIWRGDRGASGRHPGHDPEHGRRSRGPGQNADDPRAKS